MSKTLTLYEQLSEYWSESIERKENSLDKYENEFRVKYNIDETFIANSLFVNELLDYIGSVVSDNKLNFVHNKETVCLLFPYYGIRIACTKQFIENIPFVKNLLSGEWNNENIFNYEYFNKDVNEIVTGATNIVIKENTLDSILFEKPHECKVRDYENKGYYRIRNIKCNSLLDLVILNNKNRYESIHFSGGDHEF